MSLSTADRPDELADSPTGPVEEEERPLTFEDLPNDMLGVILRKVESSMDRLVLAMASPSVRRLCNGPKARPGVLGPLCIETADSSESPEKPVSLMSGKGKYEGDLTVRDLILSLSPLSSKGYAPEHEPQVLEWLRAHGRAFESVALKLSWWSIGKPRPGLDEARSNALLSALRALSDSSFQGPLKLSAATGDSASTRRFELFVSFVEANFPSKDNTLKMHRLDFGDPGVSAVLQSMTSFKEIAVKCFSGSYPPDALAKCTNLDSLSVQLLWAKGFRAPSTLKSLRSLHIGGLTSDNPLSEVLGCGSPSSLSSLESLSLMGAQEKDVRQLSALEELPALKSFSLGLDLMVRDKPEGLSISLPKLKHLSLSLMMAASTTVSEEVPLQYFSCPALRFLEVKVLDDPESDETDSSASARVDSLAAFPALECMELKFKPGSTPMTMVIGSGGSSSVAQEQFNFTFDLSAVDFRHTPALACVSSNARLALPEDPDRALKLSRHDAKKNVYGNAKVLAGLRIEWTSK